MYKIPSIYQLSYFAPPQGISQVSSLKIVGTRSLRCRIPTLHDVRQVSAAVLATDVIPTNQRSVMIYRCCINFSVSFCVTCALHLCDVQESNKALGQDFAVRARPEESPRLRYVDVSRHMCGVFSTSIDTNFLTTPWLPLPAGKVGNSYAVLTITSPARGILWSFETKPSLARYTSHIPVSVFSQLEVRVLALF